MIPFIPLNKEKRGFYKIIINTGFQIIGKAIPGVISPDMTINKYNSAYEGAHDENAEKHKHLLSEM